MTPSSDMPAFDLAPYDRALAAQLFEQAERLAADQTASLPMARGQIAALALSLCILAIPAGFLVLGIRLVLAGGPWGFLSTLAGLVLWLAAGALCPRPPPRPSNLRGPGAIPATFAVLARVADRLGLVYGGAVQITPRFGLYRSGGATRALTRGRALLPLFLARHMKPGRAPGRMVISAPLWAAASGPERLALLAHALTLELAPGPGLPIILARGVLARGRVLLRMPLAHPPQSGPADRPACLILRVPGAEQTGGSDPLSPVPPGPVRLRAARLLTAISETLDSLLTPARTRALFYADINAARLAGRAAWQDLVIKAASGRALSVTLQSLQPGGSARGREALASLATAAQAPGWPQRRDRALDHRIQMMAARGDSRPLLFAGPETGQPLDTELAPWLEEAGLALLRTRRL